MRKVAVVLLALLAAAVMASAASAAVVSTDVAYWYQASPTSAIETIFNPDSTWLNANMDKVLVTVQQTVYDAAQTATILAGDGKTAPQGGYLYAYSVNNINWADGISAFSVNWQAKPLLTATSSRVTPSFWSVSDANKPAWSSTPSDVPGIAVGETVGGFWAVASTDKSAVLTASVAQVAPGQGLLIGLSNGPAVPEPASLLALATGIVGLAGLGLRRKY